MAIRDRISVSVSQLCKDDVIIPSGKTVLSRSGPLAGNTCIVTFTTAQGYFRAMRWNANTTMPVERVLNKRR